MKNKIFKSVNGYLNYAVKLQEGLTKIPAVSPVDGGNGEYEKAAYLERELKKLKFDEITKINAPDKRVKSGIRPNIIARYKGSGNGKTLWIMSHLDIVPAGDMEFWKTYPYEAVKKGNKIYGRGAQDNNQGIVSGVLAVKALMDNGIRPPVDIALLFNADEEHDSNFGIKYILKKNKTLFGKKDMFIVPDAGNEDGSMIEVAEKSLLRFKFTVLGKYAHASDPHLSINSLPAASALILELTGKLHKKFGRSDKLFVPPKSSFECTRIEENLPNVNSISGKVVFYTDYRVLPEYKLTDIEKEVLSITKPVEKKYKVKIKVEKRDEKPAKNPTSPNSEIVKLMEKAIPQVYKVKPKPLGIGGGTVAAHLRSAGFPAVVYMRNDIMDHLPNEYCKISNILGDAKIFALSAIAAKP